MGVWRPFPRGGFSWGSLQSGVCSSSGKRSKSDLGWRVTLRRRWWSATTGNARCFRGGRAARADRILASQVASQVAARSAAVVISGEKGTRDVPRRRSSGTPGRLRLFLGPGGAGLSPRCTAEGRCLASSFLEHYFRATFVPPPWYKQDVLLENSALMVDNIWEVWRNVGQAGLLNPSLIHPFFLSTLTYLGGSHPEQFLTTAILI